MFASTHPLETHITFNLYIIKVLAVLDMSVVPSAHMVADKHFFSLLLVGYPVSQLGTHMSIL